jgi:hypothetical protein
VNIEGYVNSDSFGNDTQIRYLLNQGGRSATTAVAQAGTSSQAQPTAPATPAAIAVRTYRIGGTSPAGGLFFYDKGKSSRGILT